jgi:NADH dehydrogenase [ubiquinone] 1 alpha subcomplex assembly factor 7
VKHDIQLVELGPGKGTLMDDILRVRFLLPSLHTLRLPDETLQTLSQLPHSRASIKHVHLVESSLSLRAVQQKKLEPWDGKNGLKIHWHDSIDDIPASNGIYTMLVAHEFFDALPFHFIEVRGL